MSVLRNIAGRMASRVDDAACLWLSPRAGETAGQREIAVIRTIAAMTLVAFPAVPLALSAVLPVSLALPVGAGLVASAALLSGVGAVGYLRSKLSGREEVETFSVAAADPFDAAMPLPRQASRSPKAIIAAAPNQDAFIRLALSIDIPPCA